MENDEGTKTRWVMGVVYSCTLYLLVLFGHLLDLEPEYFILDWWHGNTQSYATGVNDNILIYVKEHICFVYPCPGRRSLSKMQWNGTLCQIGIPLPRTINNDAMIVILLWTAWQRNNLIMRVCWRKEPWTVVSSKIHLTRWHLLELLFKFMLHPWINTHHTT